MAKTSLSVNETRDMMIAVADRIIESEPILTDADRALGDGDHGVGMERGMRAAKDALEGAEFSHVGKVFTTVGMSMMSSMGGASGAIFGTLFRAGGKAMDEAETFGAAEVAAFFKAGAEGVMTRGNAKPGDKTMVDALAPAADKAEQVSGEAVSDALAAVADAAENGKEASRDLIATVGRAKTLGENSRGKPDAGAVSVAIIAAAMRDYAESV